jgi:uncharacterized membrane protein
LRSLRWQQPNLADHTNHGSAAVVSFFSLPLTFDLAMTTTNTPDQWAAMSKLVNVFFTKPDAGKN